MSVITDFFVSQMVDGLHEVVVTEQSFRGWIAKKNYEVLEFNGSKSFILKNQSHDLLLKALAFDANRMSSSAFETFHGITPEAKLPKSTGWLIIRSYYGAYFAAHAILRILGVSCSQLDFNEVRAIQDVSQLYIPKCSTVPESGYYRCKYDFINQKIDFKHLDNSHKDVWFTFYKVLDELADVGTSSNFLQDDKKLIIDFLMALRNGMSRNGKVNNGSWLSQVRNQVNYAHAAGAWFPYSKSAKLHADMFRVTEVWRYSANTENLTLHANKDELLLYLSTCSTIVALCRDLITKIKSLNSKSFLDHGAVRLLKQINTV